MIETRSDLYKLFTRPIGECECAEIGVAEGYFSNEMLRWGVRHVYMVDTWKTRPWQRGDAAHPQEWHDKNFAACAKRNDSFDGAVYLIGDSVEQAALVPDGLLDLVHLDGDHSYEGVMRDLQAWYPKLRPGGIMSGHDFLALQYGVQQAVLAFTDIRPIGIAGEEENASFFFCKDGQ